MHFDTALNLVWLVLGVIALGSTARVALRDAANRSSACLHIIGVALIVAALFPYISATDDLVRSEEVSSHQGHDRAPAKKTPNNNLVRLYETLDSPLACAKCVLTLTLLAIWIVFLPAPKQYRRAAPSWNGRSPPQFLSA